MLKNLFVLSAFSFLLTLGFAAEAQACTCTNTFRPIIIDYQAAEAVFSAEIVSVSEIPRKERVRSASGSDLLVTYKVANKYKGIPESTKLITLEADYKGSSCGFAVDDKPKPKVGQKWIVFANRATKSPQLVLTGTCGRSRVLKSKEQTSYFENALSSLDERPGIALAVIDSKKYGPFKAEKVELSGNDIHQTGQIDSEGIYQFPALPAGKYGVSIEIPFNAKLDSFFQTLDIKTKVEKDEATGKVRTVLTYEIDFKGSSYRYDQIDLVIDR